MIYVLSSGLYGNKNCILGAHGKVNGETISAFSTVAIKSIQNLHILRHICGPIQGKNPTSARGKVALGNSHVQMN